MGDEVVVSQLSRLEQASSELAVSVFILRLACSAASFNISAIPVHSEDLFHFFQQQILVFIFSHLSTSPFLFTISVLQRYCAHHLEEQK